MKVNKPSVSLLRYSLSSFAVGLFGMFFALWVAGTPNAKMPSHLGMLIGWIVALIILFLAGFIKTKKGEKNA